MGIKIRALKFMEGDNMNFKLGKGGDIKVIQIFKDEENIIQANRLYIQLKERDLFKGNLGEVFINIIPGDECIIFLGLGEKDQLTIDLLRKIFYNLGKELIKYKIDSVEIEMLKFKDLCYNKIIGAVVEGLLQSEYRFEKYLTVKKTKHKVKEVYLDILENRDMNPLNYIKETENIMDGVFLARDLVNEPAINMYPNVLARSAKDELEGVGVKVQIYSKMEIENLNMKSFLAVSEGSNKEPQFIVMTYNGNPQSDDKLALIGKGLTYDSGGYSLKPTESMETMFTDMAGAASVIGAMKSIAKEKLKKNVVGIVAACENLISGRAYKPGDIINSMSGKTIEVVNTDAEGRLTLADALWYATTVIKANKIIDLATLTYSCIATFGNINSGAITNNKDLMKRVIVASKLAGEPIWQMPNNDEYRELNKSEYADLVNDNNKGGGAIAAGLFLSEFTNNTPWVHIDIAGTAYNRSERSYLPKGATGIHVKTLYNLAKQLQYES